MISPSASLLLSLYPGNDMASAFRATAGHWRPSPARRDPGYGRDQRFH